MIAGYAEELYEHPDGFFPVAQPVGPGPAAQQLVVSLIPLSHIAVAQSDLAALCPDPAALSPIDW